MTRKITFISLAALLVIIGVGVYLKQSSSDNTVSFGKYKLNNSKVLALESNNSQLSKIPPAIQNKTDANIVLASTEQLQTYFGKNN